MYELGLVLALAATLGQESVEPAEQLIRGLLNQLTKAQTVVAHQAGSSESERREIVEAVKARVQ
jgi:hypothetical protein